MLEYIFHLLWHL